MNLEPTTEQLQKLPKWARDHVKKLKREREVAVSTLNKHVEAQPPSFAFWDELPCTGESRGPSLKRMYIPATVFYLKCPDSNSREGYDYRIQIRDEDISISSAGVMIIQHDSNGLILRNKHWWDLKK